MLLRVLLSLALMVTLSLGAHAEKRLALVIGNSKYTNVPALANPARDGEAITSLLRSIGFVTDSRLNLDRAGFEAALAAFSEKADDADIAIVYFAGHGIEVDGTNYLIPVDAKLASDKRARYELISLDDVLASLDGVQGLRAVFLDACRNNPFIASMTRSKATRSIAQGFTPVEARNGTIISYAAKEGTVAADGLGQHSPYATALLAHMPQPGLEIQFMLRKVRDQVQQLTNGTQEPYISASISGDPIYLVPSPEAQAPGAPGSVVPGSIQDDFQAATNINTAGAWQAFLDEHGRDSSNFYVRLAVEARQKLVQPAAALESAGQGAIRDIEPSKPDATVQEDAATGTKPTSVDEPKTKPPNPEGATKKKPVKAKATTPANKQKAVRKKQPPKEKAQSPPRAAKLKDRPNATRYSYRVWSEGSLRTGRATSQSTDYGTLTCTAMKAFGTEEEVSRICRWR